jgi:hypothetical protein
LGEDLLGAGEEEGLFEGGELGEEGADLGFFGGAVGCSGVRLRGGMVLV